MLVTQSFIKTNIPKSLKLPIVRNNGLRMGNIDSGIKLTTKYMQADKMYKVHKNFYTIGIHDYIPSENGGI